MWQSLEILNNFNTLQNFYKSLEQLLNFEINFWKMQTLFKKLELHFLVESNKIDNITLPYETVLSEANVKKPALSQFIISYNDS